MLCFAKTYQVFFYIGNMNKKNLRCKKILLLHFRFTISDQVKKIAKMCKTPLKVLYFFIIYGPNNISIAPIRMPRIIGFL